MLRSCAALGLVVISVTPLAAQLNVHVSHGSGRSGITGYDYATNKMTYQVPLPTVAVPSLLAGDSVCFFVNDAHAVFYNYTVGITVDTTSERLPNVSSAVALLAQVLGGSTRAGAAADAATMISNTSDYIGEFYKLFIELDLAIAAAKKEIERSDVDGIKIAKAAVGGLPPTPTTAQLNAWYEKASKESGVNSMVLAALKAHGETLLSTRDAMKTSYASTVPEIVSKCGAVGKGKTTFRLDVKKKTSFGGRDVRDGIAAVVVAPRYERAPIEAFPVLLAGFVRDAPEFAVDGGVVRKSVLPDKRIYRPGGVISLNLPPSEAFAYGPFVAFGATSDNKLALSDLLFGAIFSYKDLVRIGVGIGNSELKTDLRAPARENEPLPNNTRLDDVLVTRDKHAWYLLLALPKLTIKSPWP